MDESILLTYFQIWMKEDDAILSDFCYRFINRKLFQYAEFDPATEYRKIGELEQLFKEAGIDPDYYLVADSSSDLPYDFYRPGEENERLPIYLQMPNGELSELSRSSDIVDAISGKRRTDHKIYFPEDLLKKGKKKSVIRKDFRYTQNAKRDSSQILKWSLQRLQGARVIQQNVAKVATVPSSSCLSKIVDLHFVQSPGLIELPTLLRLGDLSSRQMQLERYSYMKFNKKGVALLLQEHAKIVQFISIANEVKGRKKMQKMIYIAKKMNFPFAEKYELAYVWSVFGGIDVTY